MSSLTQFSMKQDNDSNYHQETEGVDRPQAGCLYAELLYAFFPALIHNILIAGLQDYLIDFWKTRPLKIMRVAEMSPPPD